MDILKRDELTQSTSSTEKLGFLVRHDEKKNGQLRNQFEEKRNELSLDKARGIFSLNTVWER